MRESELIRLIICLVVNAEAPIEEKLAMLRWLFEREHTALNIEEYEREASVVRKDPA